MFELSWETLHDKVTCVSNMPLVWWLWSIFFFFFSCSSLVFSPSYSKFQNNHSIYFPLRFDLYFFYYYLFYMKKFIKLDFFQFHPLNFLYIKFAPHSFNCYSSKEICDLTLHWFFFLSDFILIVLIVIFFHFG